MILFFIIKWACGQYVCLNELHGRNTIKTHLNYTRIYLKLQCLMFKGI